MKFPMIGALRVVRLAVKANQHVVGAGAELK